MAGWRAALSGPDRAVIVLAVTQVLTWGILIYPPVLIMPPLAASHGWSLGAAMAGFSLGLIVSGLVSPFACGLIDRHGGNGVMAAGALAGAAGLAGIALSDDPISYALCWTLLGCAMAATLYDAAFATLAGIFGVSARRQITFVTFAGGFASTAGWPLTQLLIDHVGWRGAYWTFAAVFAVVVAPLFAFALPRGGVTAARAEPDSAVMPALEPRNFLLLASGFALYAFILSGVTSTLLALLQRNGIGAAEAVTIGALFGPAQVASRLGDFLLSGRTHPLWVTRVALLVVLTGLALLAFGDISFAVAAVFAIGFGAANGVMTIARGALPLLMFGASGYGRIIGRVARPALFVQALAPFVVSSAFDRFGDRPVLAAGVVATLVVLACFAALRAPQFSSRPADAA